ncbi:hypothetical protein PT310_00785 [Metamycoplasma hyosynoviae]|uniref:hypothetical protein n=1 Tax=Metamycoplasma hyosynoviae TaxID=29559 RepID=UPI0023618118|nr:hypothetical protein [Metamycoplasma hyosynoviae]MDD1378166.1 hypothetical protein [Metamycoplasma hyosynoviae]
MYIPMYIPFLVEPPTPKPKMPELGLTIAYKLTFKTYLNYLDESIDDNFFYDNFNKLILITNPSQANNLDWIKVPKNKKFIFYFFNYYYLINLDKMPENEEYFFCNFFWSFGLNDNVVTHICNKDLNSWYEYFIQDIPSYYYMNRNTNGILFQEWFYKFIILAQKRHYDYIDFWFYVLQEKFHFLQLNFNVQDKDFINAYHFERNDIEKIAKEILKCNDISNFVSNDKTINKIIELFDNDFLRYCNSYKNEYCDDKFSMNFFSPFLNWFDLTLKEIETNWFYWSKYIRELLIDVSQRILLELSNINNCKNIGDEYQELNIYLFYILSLLFLLKQNTREAFIFDWKFFLNEYIKFEINDYTEGNLAFTTIEEFKEDDYKNANFIYLNDVDDAKEAPEKFILFNKSLYSLEIDGFINSEEYYKNKNYEVKKRDLKNISHYKRNCYFYLKKKRREKIAVIIMLVVYFIVMLIVLLGVFLFI